MERSKMPLYYDTEIKKWVLDLSREEVIALPSLLLYLQNRINTKCVFVDKNNKINTMADLRFYNDDDFFLT